MQLHRDVLIRRDPDAVFALVSDVTNYADFFRGVTRWEPRSDQLTGVGADFRVLMQVGSIEAGGVVTVTEWDEDGRRIVWRSVRGVDHHGRWEVEPVDDGSRLVLMLAFELSGPFRWLVERITGRIVARHLEATLLGARRMLEYQDR